MVQPRKGLSQVCFYAKAHPKLKLPHSPKTPEPPYSKLGITQNGFFLLSTLLLSPGKKNPGSRQTTHRDKIKSR